MQRIGQNREQKANSYNSRKNCLKMSVVVIVVYNKKMPLKLKPKNYIIIYIYI